MNTTPASPREAEATRKIIVGVDGSAASVPALREGARLAADRDADLVAVYAWHIPVAYGGIPTDWAPEIDATAILDATARAAFGDTPPARYRQQIREGAPASVLIDESEGAEMLVVGSRGHGGFVGLLLGSVSQACAEYAKCPVLILHGDPTEPAAPAA